jgi:hypothetical protein
MSDSAERVENEITSRAHDRILRHQENLVGRHLNSFGSKDAGITISEETFDWVVVFPMWQQQERKRGDGRFLVLTAREREREREREKSSLEVLGDHLISSAVIIDCVADDWSHTASKMRSHLQSSLCSWFLLRSVMFFSSLYCLTFRGNQCYNRKNVTRGKSRMNKVQVDSRFGWLWKVVNLFHFFKQTFSRSSASLAVCDILLLLF